MFYHILAFMAFLPILTVCNIFMLSFVFYSDLKMTLKRWKRRDFLALTFITKSISKKLLINNNFFLIFNKNNRSLLKYSEEN